ncbi:MAG: hypothetical protein V8Q43_00840 [Christensenellaceae bacterium]
MGIYELLEMPERIGKLRLPEMQIVDMKREYQRGNRGPVSLALYQAIRQVLARDEQGMVFLNRRGYASSLVCPSCGEARLCTHCDVPLKYHKALGKLLCHYCGRTFAASAVCPACGAKAHAVYRDRERENAGAAADAFSRGAHPAHGF